MYHHHVLVEMSLRLWCLYLHVRENPSPFSFQHAPISVGGTYPVNDGCRRHGIVTFWKRLTIDGEVGLRLFGANWQLPRANYTATGRQQITGLDITLLGYSSRIFACLWSGIFDQKLWTPAACATLSRTLPATLALISRTSSPLWTLMPNGKGMSC